MRATVKGVVRHAEKRTINGGDPFVEVSLEQRTDRGKPYLITVNTHNQKDLVLDREKSFEVNIRGTVSKKSGQVFINAWEVEPK